MNLLFYTTAKLKLFHIPGDFHWFKNEPNYATGYLVPKSSETNQNVSEFNVGYGRWKQIIAPGVNVYSYHWMTICTLPVLTSITSPHCPLIFR
jgi:hypothetical protein